MQGKEKFYNIIATVLEEIVLTRREKIRSRK